MTSGCDQRALKTCLPSILVLAAALGGCSSGGGAARPQVAATAAQLFGADPAYELDFYDRLDRLPVVAHDDAIHAVLLLSGESAPTYSQRVALAKSRGLLADNFNRPAREAVTIGEVAAMVERVITGRAESYGEATSQLSSRGIIPRTARSSQGLSGSQLLALLGGSEDFLTSQEEAPNFEEPLAVEPIAPGAAANAPAPVMTPDEDDAFAGFETDPTEVREIDPMNAPAPERPRDVATNVEPLPDLPDESPEPPPNVPVVAVVPVEEPAPAPEPAPTQQAPATPAATGSAGGGGPGNPWIPGKPLRQGGR